MKVIYSLIVFALLSSVMYGGDTSIRVDNRWVLVHTPKNVSVANPLVLNFHALSSNGAAQANISQMNGVADKYNFIVAYPYGVNNSWNAGGCCGYARDNKIDDISFVKNVLSTLAINYKVDSKKIYACGFSNGGMLAHRCAIDMPGIFAAIGSVSSSNVYKAPINKMNVMMINGTRDNLVPYNNAVTSANQWKSLGGNVEFITVTNGRHQWFSGSSEKLWLFFTKYKL